MSERRMTNQGLGARRVDPTRLRRAGSALPVGISGMAQREQRRGFEFVVRVERFELSLSVLRQLARRDIAGAVTPEVLSARHPQRVGVAPPLLIAAGGMDIR